MDQAMTPPPSPVAGDRGASPFSPVFVFAVAVSCIAHLSLLFVASSMLLPDPLRRPRSVVVLNVALPEAEKLLGAPSDRVQKMPVHAISQREMALVSDSTVASAESAEIGTGYLSPSQLDKLASFSEGALDIELPVGMAATVPTGPVRLLILIGSNGMVDQVLVLSDSDFAIQAALLATKWRFVPAEKDGIPVASKKLVELSFEAGMSFQ